MTEAALEAAIDDLAHGFALLVRRIRAAAANLELSMSESAVLGRLEKDGPATTADLARAESVKPQSMGTTVASLEEMGLVERRPHPTDGRQALLALTEKGAQTRQNMRKAKRTWLAQAIAKLDEHDQKALFEAGEIIKRLVEL